MVRLPSEYQEVEYIQSSGTQWIDTGIRAKTSTVTKFKVMNLEVSGNVIIGYHPGSDAADWRLFNANSKVYFDVPGSSSEGNRINGGTWVTNTIMELEAGNFYVKNLATGSNIVETMPVEWETRPYTITLNNYNNSRFAKNRWYYVKIYDGDELVFDGIPAYQKSNNVTGMYDTVSGTFFTNSGTGEFVVGPDVTATGISTGLMARRRAIMGKQPAVKVPNVYKNGQFAKEFGGYTVPDPPMSQYKMPDEWYVTPVIYGHFVRNAAPTYNDCLRINTNNTVALSAYSSVDLNFEIERASTGLIEILADEALIGSLSITGSEADGAHTATISITAPSTAKHLNIRIRFTATSTNTIFKINSILLNE